MAKRKFKIDLERIDQISNNFYNTADSYRGQFSEIAQKVNDIAAEYNEAVMEYNEFIDGAHSDLQEYVTEITDMIHDVRSKYESRSEKWRYSEEGEEVGKWVDELEVYQPQDVEQLEELSEVDEEDVSGFDSMIDNVEIRSIIDNCLEEPELIEEDM